MAGNPFTFTIGTVTATSIQVSTSGGPTVDSWVFDLYKGNSATGDIIYEEVTGPGDQTYTFTGLNPSTTYTIRAISDESADYDTTETTTTSDSSTPKTATYSQWVDLADKVNSKAEIGSILSTPSDVAYVNSDNIINSAVTTGKIATGAVTTGKIATGAVTADKTDFGGNYSTSEVDTGFTWIDGSDIYKKTINFGALPNNTNKRVAHGITNLNKAIELKGYTSDGTTFAPLPLASTTGAPTVMFVDSTDIVFVTSSDRTAYTETYITIYYTKTS